MATPATPFRPQIEREGHIEIPLTQGQVAIVDLDAPQFVRESNWCAQWSPRSKTFYATRYVQNGRRQVLTLLHRVILGISDKSIVVDHRDGNGLNNRRGNLRPCTHQQNCFNSAPRGGASRFKGLYRKSGQSKWYASIMKNGRSVHLGSFATEEEAALAYNAAAIRLFGEFAYLNQVDNKETSK